MKTKITSTLCAAAALFCASCAESSTDSSESKPIETAATTNANYGGYESQVKWGEHLVKIGGCNDCHTPKKMGPNGPEDDMSLMLSGHPAQMPAPPFDQKEAAKKGLVVSQTFTAWIGAWGTTYAPNITPHSTGIGAWTEEQFLKAVKEGKWKGLDSTRPMMPPMSAVVVGKMTDDETKAVFAYLKTIPPIHNIAPEAALAQPPPAPAK